MKKKSFLEFGFDNCLLQRIQIYENKKIITRLENKKMTISEEVNNPLTNFIKNFYLAVEENSRLKIDKNFLVKNFFRLIEIVYD